MRHGKKFNHLGRKAPHRKAMLSNMASSLILNKRITTTVAKAKALRKFVEPILTKSKNDTTHSRRTVFSYLNDKHTVKSLFDEVAEKIANRPGGYTRIIKTGNRLGDNADMCIIELVDYNEFLLKDSKDKAKPSTRRSRRRKSSAKQNEGTQAEAITDAVVVEEEVESTKESEVSDDKNQIADEEEVATKDESTDVSEAKEATSAEPEGKTDASAEDKDSNENPESSEEKEDGK